MAGNSSCEESSTNIDHMFNSGGGNRPQIQNDSLMVTSQKLELKEQDTTAQEAKNEINQKYNKPYRGGSKLKKGSKKSKMAKNGAMSYYNGRKKKNNPKKYYQNIEGGTLT